MKAPALIALLLMSTGAAHADDTTSLRNGSNAATVTQSGNPADTRKTIEQSPGHTRIEQHNGSNSATITQNTTGGGRDAPITGGPYPGGPYPGDHTSSGPAPGGPTPGGPASGGSTAGGSSLDGTDMGAGGMDDEDDWAFDPAPKDKPDVFGTIRRDASPQSKAMLDRLMGEMKLHERGH